MTKDPIAWLNEINANQVKRGRLKIFLGYAAGVGKTYRMLEEGRALLDVGVDVVIGYVETHQRAETMTLVDGFEQIPVSEHKYRDTIISELSVKNIIARQPDIVIIDELAHTNSSSWNQKRYQDIEEILSSGISVYTAVNVQHLESLHELMHLITGVDVKETVPDSFIDGADDIELIDIEPAVLLNRLSAGKIYRRPQAEMAVKNFFKNDHLTQLREIALQQVTRHVGHDNSKNGQKTRHFLVAISESPNAVNAIHWAYRQAQAFGAPWTAVYVNTRENYLPSEGLKNNLKIVKELGGEVAVLNASSVGDALIQYMQESKISNLVIGKHAQSKWYGFFEQNFEAKIMRAIPFVDIQIIPGVIHNDSWPTKMATIRNQITKMQLTDIVVAAIILFMATIINLVLHAYVAENSIKIMLYFIAVVLIARFTRGYSAGIVSSFASVAIFDYLFVKPLYSLKIDHSYYGIVFFMMVLTTVIISGLTSKLTTQMKYSVKEAKRSAILSDLSTTLIGLNSPQMMSQKLADIVSEYFGQHVQIFYTRNDYVLSHHSQQSEFLLDDNNREIIQWVWHHNQMAGHGTETLSGRKLFYVPITFKNRPLAVLVVRGNDFDYPDRLELQIFLFPLALVLDNYYLGQEKRKIAIANANNQLKSDLLRSISHDLRTPLTSIIASTEHLLTAKSLSAEQQLLLHNINKESNWLIQMIENILTITKISQGSIQVNKSFELVDDAVLAAIEKFKWLNPFVKIDVKMPDKLLWINIDNNLFQQVIINLLDNAIKHGQINAPVHVIVRANGQSIAIIVRNMGPLLTPLQIEKLTHASGEINNKKLDRKRGLGIGLFLCKTIIKLHDGKLSFSNWHEGPEVTITMPAKE